MRFEVGIRAGRLLSMKDGSGEVDKDQFVGIQGNRIAVIEPYLDSHAAACDKYIDAADQIVMPGLINGHTHLAMVMFRGFEDDRPFHEWIFDRILPLEGSILDADFVTAGTELAALECIRFGTTTVNEMYYFYEAAAEVLDRAGMRALIGAHFIDFSQPDEKSVSGDFHDYRVTRFAKFHELYRWHDRIRPVIAAHAPYTCGDDLLRKVSELALQADVPIHFHLCETRGEVEESIRKYGMKPVQRLEKLGILDRKFIAAHGVHLDDEDIAILKRKGVSVVYNPDSNAKLSSGVAPIPKLRSAGIAVSLGTDGAASNNDLSLFGAMDLGTKIQKLTLHSNTGMTAIDAINLATLEGARALGLDREVGSIEVGKRADLISLRTDYPHTQPLYSVLSQLVYSYQGLEVNHVICDGRVLLEDQAHTTLDSRAIYGRVETMKRRVQDAHKKMKEGLPL